jgi:hypothetical protein
VNRALVDESLRISIDVLHVLEAGAMPMHAADYRHAASHLHEALAQIGIDELLAIARSAPGVLSEAAEAVLYTLGCEDRVEPSAARQSALFEAQDLLRRLRQATASDAAPGDA